MRTYVVFVLFAVALIWGKRTPVLAFLDETGHISEDASRRTLSEERPGAADSPWLDKHVESLPLFFTENRGQLHNDVAFYLRGKDRTVFFSREAVTVSLTTKSSRWSVPFEFVDADPGVSLRGAERRDAVVSYFKGSKPEGWQPGCPTYERIVYEELWPGVDLVFKAGHDRLKHEFVVAPGTDPGCIRMAVHHATVRVDTAGNLLVETPYGSLKDDRPLVYQEIGGKRVVIECAYAIEQTAPSSAQYTFVLQDYDGKYPLVIDPEMVIYSGFLGGFSDDIGYDIAVGVDGSSYVVGSTASFDFPTVGGWDPSYNGGNWDAFVVRINPSGSGFIYASYLGSQGWDEGYGIAVDSTGAAYVTGQAGGNSFPTVGTLGPDYQGDWDVFVTKINSLGTALIYSGFIGGGDSDIGNAIAVDGAGAAYVTGRTSSNAFPTVGGLPTTFGGGPVDAFVTKVDPLGSTIVYSGLLGGGAWDEGDGIAVDSSGAAHVAGRTSSSNYPATVGPDTSYNGSWDAFVTKVAPLGNAIMYSGFIGGSEFDGGIGGVAVDGSGAAYVAGRTDSNDFPTIGPLGTVFAGKADAFISKVHPSGESLIYSGLFGDDGYDYSEGVAVDSNGGAYVTGVSTSSSGFFLLKVKPDGTAFVSTAYIGGSDVDHPLAVAVDGVGAAYLTGWTSSIDFPTVGDLGPEYNGGPLDAFVTKVVLDEEAPPVELELLEVKGLRKSSAGQFTQEENPQSDGRLFLDTIDDGQILRAPNRQSVELSVKVSGIVDPTDYVVRWELRDPDDPATHTDLDPSPLGGDNTGTPHEAESFWFSEAKHFVFGEQNHVPANENTVIGEAQTFLSVEADAFESSVRFNYSDDGGDNFRIRVALLNLDGQEVAFDQSGILTVWRLRYVQTYAMKKPNDDVQRYSVGSDRGAFEVCIEPGPNAQSDTLVLGGDDGRDEAELYVHTGVNGIVETTANSGGESFDAEATAATFRDYYARGEPDHLAYIDFKVVRSDHDGAYSWILPYSFIVQYMHEYTTFRHRASLMSLLGVNRCRVDGREVGGVAGHPPHSVVSTGIIKLRLPEFLEKANVHEVGHLLLTNFENVDAFHRNHSVGQNCGFSQSMTLPPQICSRHVSLLRDRIPQKFSQNTHAYADVSNDSEKSR